MDFFHVLHLQKTYNQLKLQELLPVQAAQEQGVNYYQHNLVNKFNLISVWYRPSG
ncbi:hypothetical protein LHGZ1_1961 [Laribacter hongkongensis]|uniref:Uncharacterized protein n=1 Tax=Laribacter hongkongensis TaxID=168471 RepID=A0A248LJG3_9NEIS|nr:hypothetical protein LHGZ1_1961 [Laribacter hongkongensis]